MKMRVLGAHAPYAPADRACNGYLLEAGETNVMVDCGNGSFANLEKHLDFRQLEALIITHYHPDHFHDYHCIRHAIAGSLRDGSRKTPLLVYAPFAKEGAWPEMMQWDGVFKLHPIEDYLGTVARINGISIRFKKTRHPVTTYGTAVYDDTKKIVYTSDTSWDEGLVEFARDAACLICEASLTAAEVSRCEEKGHLTAGLAGLFAARAGADLLVLTHLWPETDKALLLQEARETFDGKIMLAEEDLIIEV